MWRRNTLNLIFSRLYCEDLYRNPESTMQILHVHKWWSKATKSHNRATIHRPAPWSDFDLSLIFSTISKNMKERKVLKGCQLQVCMIQVIPLLLHIVKFFQTTQLKSVCIWKDVESFLECTALTGKNVTNVALEGCDLQPHVGQQAILHIEIDGSALLYMVGFGQQ